MNQPTSPNTLRRNDGLTAFALAAGLVFGHFVQAMAESGVPGAVTMFSAVVFVAAATAGTVCALVTMASRADAARARARAGGWVLAIGTGFLAALAPTML